MTNMTRKAMELYLYMGSSDPIIKWLESEGVKTKSEAREKLAPLVESNLLDFARHIGSGSYGGSLHGTNRCVDAVFKHFKD